MIQSRTELRTAIMDAEHIASRMELPHHKLTMGERRVIARLLKDLADIGRRAFDPDARYDWGIIPRPTREDDDAPGLFPPEAA